MMKAALMLRTQWCERKILTGGADFENGRKAQDVAVRLCSVKRNGFHTLRFAK
jgi:hypothetical protein